ncbi:hypothetical protein DB30_00955 [Enhygromyxa salina]|uniref:Uncharacterized protein n=1 Tax=Enhygromyxa salina TaxID=215803 RepID=A0A0C2CYC7_9BACT|nr:hypothetical protein DB30_00955 [Enhygromyxa salina]
MCRGGCDATCVPVAGHGQDPRIIGSPLLSFIVGDQQIDSIPAVYIAEELLGEFRRIVERPNRIIGAASVGWMITREAETVALRVPQHLRSFGPRRPIARELWQQYVIAGVY